MNTKEITVIPPEGYEIDREHEHYTLCLKDDILKISDGEFSIYKQLRSSLSFDNHEFLLHCIDEFRYFKKQSPKPKEMNTKEITVIPPEGYEIDREHSTLERIVFKALPKNELPRKWEDLGKIRGYWVHGDNAVIMGSDIIGLSTDGDSNKNLWPTYKEAEASIALAQLCQLRDRYNEGWKPDWTAGEGLKYCISIQGDKPDAVGACHQRYVLHFKTPQLRNAFLDNFRDLIDKAKPLL